MPVTNNTETAYREMVAQMGFGLLMLNGDAAIQSVDDHIATLLTTTAASLQGQSFLDVIHQDHQDAAVEYLESILAGQAFSGMQTTTLNQPQGTSTEVEYVAAQTDYGFAVMMRALTRTQSTRTLHDIQEGVYYRQLARHLPGIAVFVFDHDLRYLVAEGSGLARVGYPSERVEGRTVWEVMPRAEAEFMAQHYRQVLSGESVQIQQFEFANLIFRIDMLPVRDSHNNIIAGMVITFNITDEVRSREALKASRDRTLALLETVPDTIFVLDRQGTYVEFESNVIDTNAPLAPAPIPGVNLRTINAPDWLVRMAFEAIERAFATNQTYTFTYEWDTRKRHLVYEVRLTPLPGGQELLVIHRDMTDLRETQAELEERVAQLTLLNQVEGELAEELDIDYVLSMALDAMLRLSRARYGFIAMQEDDRMVVKRLIGGYSPEQLAQHLNGEIGVVARSIHAQQPEFVPDVTRDPDYVPLVAESRAQLVIPLISREKLIGVLNLETNVPENFTADRVRFVKLVTARIAVAIDNAQLHEQTAAQLNEITDLYEQVKRLEQLKTDMIRIASHDLRNPLTSLMNVMTLLEMNAETDSREYIQMAQESAMRMRKIISDILSLERINQLAKDQTLNILDFRKIVKKVYTQDSKQAEAKSQTCTIHLPSDSMVIACDAVQLNEAIHNLITNAIKYTPEGGRIDVRVTYGDGKLIFLVRDNGYGIEESKQQRLFEPFYRATNEETKDIDGTGLGLHLVKNIIERHGGRMFFESVYGEGSTFGFELPLHTEFMGMGNF